MGTQCRGPSSNGPMLNLRLTSCLRSSIFSALACTPSMLAVAVDGNRKLYRFKSQPGCVRFMYNEMLVSHKLLLYSKFNPHLYISFKT